MMDRLIEFYSMLPGGLSFVVVVLLMTIAVAVVLYVRLKKDSIENKFETQLKLKNKLGNNGVLRL